MDVASLATVSWGKARFDDAVSEPAYGRVRFHRSATTYAGEVSRRGAWGRARAMRASRIPFLSSASSLRVYTRTASARSGTASSLAREHRRQRKTLVRYVSLDVGTRVDRSPRYHPDCRHALGATASHSSFAAGGLLRRTCRTTLTGRHFLPPTASERVRRGVILPSLHSASGRSRIAYRLLLSPQRGPLFSFSVSINDITMACRRLSRLLR